MNCSHCGTSIQPGNRFCPSCGAQVNQPQPVNQSALAGGVNDLANRLSAFGTNKIAAFSASFILVVLTMIAIGTGGSSTDDSDTIAADTSISAPMETQENVLDAEDQAMKDQEERDRLEEIERTTTRSAFAEEDDGLYSVVARFKHIDGAKRLLNEIQNAGFFNTVIHEADDHFQVRTGPFKDREEAMGHYRTLLDAGIQLPDFYHINDDSP